MTNLEIIDSLHQRIAKLEAEKQELLWKLRFVLKDIQKLHCTINGIINPEPPKAQ